MALIREALRAKLYPYIYLCSCAQD